MRVARRRHVARRGGNGSAMGGNYSTTLDDEDIARLTGVSGFTGNQIKTLFERFQDLDKRQIGKIRKEDFLKIPELVINPIFERILCIFDIDGTDDVDFNQFVKVLSVFRNPEMMADPELNDEKQLEEMRTEKMKFIFQIYDIKNDGFIDTEEMSEVIKIMAGDYITDDELAQIVKQTFDEADMDKDGKLSFAEFRQVIEHTNIQERLSISFL